MAEDWSREEVEATVADYFSMLESELRGEQYDKADRNRRLRYLLANRSKGAVEYKHGNISAVLRDARFPWISGYKPYGNYQRLLAEVVLDRLDSHDHLQKLARAIADGDISPTYIEDVQAVAPPRAEHPGLYIREQDGPIPRTYRARRIDYFEREAQNRSLGRAGEELVVRLERQRLLREGAPRLAEKVEWVARTLGDGAGFDVLSFEPSGKERFIEVKTTSFSRETPFYTTRNEVSFSYDFREQYRLYRLFDFRKAPRLYTLTGALEESCRLEAISFMADVR
jgi:hypothetical protein